MEDKVYGENLNDCISIFIRHIDSIRDTMPMTIHLIKPYSLKAINELDKFMNDKVQTSEENNEERYVVEFEELKLFESLERNASISSIALKVISESLFVSLISQYDAFLTRLLKSIFEIKPEVLNSSDKNLSFSQLVSFGTIDEAREYIIEKEIETVLRKSHADQFEYLEKLLDIKLRENLPIWRTFIEITERRNLFVHCDGNVSNQYIKVCKEHKCFNKDITVNSKLEVLPDYFLDAYYCLYEISVKLTFTVWRKLLKNELKYADNELNTICYNLLTSDSFKLADILLSFACNQKKHYNEVSKCLFVVNKALSQYLQNKKEAAKNILNDYDWSARSLDFKLAYEVLNDNHEAVYSLMRKIGNKGDIDKFGYREWPLFYGLRCKQEFKDTYKDIFKEEYAVIEKPLRPVQEIIAKELSVEKETTKESES